LGPAHERIAFLDIELDEEAYRRERATHQAELEAITVPDTKKVEEGAAFLQTLVAVWDRATSAERRELLHLLLDAVRVDVLGRRILAIQPKPAFISLFRQIPGLDETNGWFGVWVDDGGGPRGSQNAGRDSRFAFGVLLRFPCLGHLSVDENTKGKPILPSPALAAEGMSRGQLPAVPSTGNVAAVAGRRSGALQDPEITNVHPL